MLVYRQRICRHCNKSFQPTGSVGVFCSLFCKVWGRIEVKEENECWPWQGSVTKGGYATLGGSVSPQYISRIILNFDGRPCVGDQYACHACDNPRCCNPKHLWPGTNSENQKDSVLKGRKPSGERHVRARLSNEQAEIIRSMPFEIFTHMDIAQLLDCSRSVIGRIVRGESYKNATV